METMSILFTTSLLPGVCPLKSLNLILELSTGDYYQSHDSGIFVTEHLVVYGDTLINPNKS